VCYGIIYFSHVRLEIYKSQPPGLVLDGDPQKLASDWKEKLLWSLHFPPYPPQFCLRLSWTVQHELGMRLWPGLHFFLQSAHLTTLTRNIKKITVWLARLPLAPHCLLPCYSIVVYGAHLFEGNHLENVTELANSLSIYIITQEAKFTLSRVRPLCVAALLTCWGRNPRWKNHS